MQALQQNLILPFTQSPSAKLLGIALTQLAHKVLPTLRMEAVSLLVDEKVVIEDIRKLDWRYSEELDEKHHDTEPLVFNLTDKSIKILL